MSFLSAREQCLFGPSQFCLNRGSIDILSKAVVGLHPVLSCHGGGGNSSMKIETFGFVRSHRVEPPHEDGDVISMMPGAASVCADFGREFHAY